LGSKAIHGFNPSDYYDENEMKKLIDQREAEATKKRLSYQKPMEYQPLPSLTQRQSNTPQKQQTPNYEGSVFARPSIATSVRHSDSQKYSDSKRSESLAEEPSYLNISELEKQYTGTVSVEVRVSYEESEKRFNVLLHKSRKISELCAECEKYMANNLGYRPGLDDGFFLTFKNQIVYSEQSLEELEMHLQQNCVVYLLFDKKMPSARSSQISKEPSSSRLQERSGSSAFKETSKRFDETLAPQELLPKDPKPGYKITPSMSEIARMTTAQLKKVDGFIIENEHGRIEFLEPVDLTGVDLEDAVTIEPNAIEVYKDDDLSKVKPLLGQKLNHPAKATLFRVPPTKRMNTIQYEGKLKAMIENNHVRHQIITFQ